MTRILLLIPSLVGAGGTERMVAKLAQLLSKDNDVHVASFDPASTMPHFNPGVPFHPLGQANRLPLPLRPFTYAAEARRVRALKRRLGIGLTLSNLWRADLVNILAGGSDAKVALCHINIVGNRTNALMLKFLPLVRTVYGRFDKVVAVSEVLKHELADLYQLTDEKACHIDNFIDVPAEQYRAPAEEKPLLVWCGRLVPEKNAGALIDIFAGIKRRHPKVRLTMLGTGPELEQIRQRAISHGLRLTGEPDRDDTDIELPGSVPDPLPAMCKARLLLSTSIAEGLPMTMLEAAALGVPVAAADCPAGGVATLLMGTNVHDPYRRAAIRSEMGVLLPVPDLSKPETIETWVAELSELMTDETALHSMRAGALRRSRDFTPEAARPKWCALIDEVCGTVQRRTGLSV